MIYIECEDGGGIEIFRSARSAATYLEVPDVVGGAYTLAFDEQGRPVELLVDRGGPNVAPRWRRLLSPHGARVRVEVDSDAKPEVPNFVAMLNRAVRSLDPGFESSDLALLRSRAEELFGITR